MADPADPDSDADGLSDGVEAGVTDPVAGGLSNTGVAYAGTEGSFAGAQVHQRSNLVSVSPDGTTTSWTGELRLMPASA